MCNVIGGEFIENIETTEIKYFSLDEIPDNVVTITDTGIGMTEEQMSHIFEKYYQVEKSKTMQGLGLGLTIVNRILNLVNGKIEVTSELGEGSTFTVTLTNE